MRPLVFPPLSLLITLDVCAREFKRQAAVGRSTRVRFPLFSLYSRRSYLAQYMLLERVKDGLDLSGHDLLSSLALATESPFAGISLAQFWILACDLWHEKIHNHVVHSQDRPTPDRSCNHLKGGRQSKCKGSANWANRPLKENHST